jgi:hypothetical protein
MKDTRYKYVFTHCVQQAKLKFEATTIQEAVRIIGSLVSSVEEWNMKRFRIKKGK